MVKYYFVLVIFCIITSCSIGYNSTDASYSVNNFISKINDMEEGIEIDIEDPLLQIYILKTYFPDIYIAKVNGYVGIKKVIVEKKDNRIICNIKTKRLNNPYRERTILWTNFNTNSFATVFMEKSRVIL